MVEARGSRLVYLLAYSPDLNPIEEAFSSIKAWLCGNWDYVLGEIEGDSVDPYVKKQPSQDVLHGDEAEKELGLARLVSSYTLPHQNSQPGERGRQTDRKSVV